MERRRAHARRHALEHRRQGTDRAKGTPHQDDSGADRRTAEGLHGLEPGARPLACVFRIALPVAHRGDQAQGRKCCIRRARAPSPARAASRDRQHPRLCQRNGGRHVARVHQGRACHPRPPDLGEPAAHQVSVHEPVARARLRLHAGRAGVRIGRRQSRANRRAGSAVRSRRQRRARHARGPATFGHALRREFPETS